VVGDVDLGPTMAAQEPLHGSDVIGPGLLRFYGPKAKVTLVSQPINGSPGVLAFRNHTLVGMLRMHLSNGRIDDLHAIADPRQLAFVNLQLSYPGSVA